MQRCELVSTGTIRQSTLLLGESHVRFYLQATASLCCLVPLSLSSAGPAPPGRAPAPTTTPAPSAPPASNAASEAFAAEAAARHIKRTACIQSAKAKKLVGNAKNDYIKDCVAQ